MAKKVLIIDDEVDFADLLKLQLEKGGYDVTTVYSGKDGLDLLKKEFPDIILLDIMMPEISGWEICSKIKLDTKTKDIPVIFLTARADDLSKAMGLKGAEGFIEKPFDPLDLIKEIEKLT